MKNQRDPRPPRLAQALLRTGLPGGLIGDSLLGDLHEEYHRKAGELGGIGAWWWYWCQCVNLSFHYLVERTLHPRQSGRSVTARHTQGSPPLPPIRRGVSMDSLQRGIRHAVQAIIRRPVPTMAAVLTLGVGLGAVTAIFGVVNGILLRSLPYDDPGALYFLEEKNNQDPALSVSYPNYLDWRENNRSFEKLAAFISMEMTLTGEGDAARLGGWAISANLFPLLGKGPVMGRVFREEEDQLGSDLVILLSHDLWMERFGGDPDVVGRSVTLAGHPWTVIGVMPRGFSFPPPSPRFGSLESAFWVPIGPLATHWSQHRDLHPGISVLGRLKRNVTASQARAEMDLIAAGLEEAYPETNAGQGVSVRAASDVIVENVRAPIWTLLGAACFLLLIACVNVANLQLARAADRTRELAVRSSLGATGGHLAWHVLTETLLVSLAGSALGLALAWGATSLYGFAAHALGPGAQQLHLDMRVLAFSVGITLLAGVLSGLIPALRAGRVQPAGMLGGRGSGARGRWHRRIHNTLMTAEVALSLMLVVGAGLMIRSFSELLRGEVGLVPENLYLAELSLSSGGGSVDPSRRTEFFHEVLRRGRDLPGISAIGAIYPQPLGMSRNAVPYEVEGEPPPPPGEYLMAEYSYVSTGYFRAVGASLVQGRTFEAQEISRRRPVAVVDETFAERHWPGERAVGKRIKTAGWQTDVPWLEIVGVVRHIKIFGVAGESWVQMYVPFESVSPGTMTVMVRADTEPALLTPEVRAMVRELDPTVPVPAMRSMEDDLADTTAPQRLWALVLGVLSAVSLLMAGMGVYGVVSYAVSRREREIGVRVALGASVQGILAGTLREAIALTVLGLAIGAALALVLSRLLSGLLFGVSNSDPATYALGSLTLLAVSLVACGIPAVRAACLDPALVLREEG